MIQVNRYALFLMIVFIILAAVPGLLAPYGLKERSLPYQDPSLEHLLGTNDIGQDILSELIYSTRISLLVGFAAGTLATVIGLIVGLVAGYYKGGVSEVLMGMTDVVLTIPKLPLIIIVAAFLRPSIWILILILGLLGWESIARVVRSKVLQIRESGFVMGAQCMGFSHPWIMASEIVPNIMHVVAPKYMLATAAAMLSEASLSFLGLGDPNNVSWGMMISFAFSRGGFIRDMWWWFLPPGICITLCILAIAAIAFSLGEDSREVWQD
ncbi:ABC transporter permease [Methanocalculus sp.]|uniref:ABC transporter permease n=1 Tax=Methanocalculus sp. TaxID=2004547 RepID=UPI002720D9D6|nr:ABC transporter permease [Methanocalculus sp.]MDO8842073.1 ABC transporter permease [Methanocalculus sp.]